METTIQLTFQGLTKTLYLHGPLPGMQNPCHITFCLSIDFHTKNASKKNFRRHGILSLQQMGFNLLNPICCWLKIPASGSNSLRSRVEGFLKDKNLALGKLSKIVLGPQFQNFTIHFCFFCLFTWRRASENVDWLKWAKITFFYKKVWSLPQGVCLL